MSLANPWLVVLEVLNNVHDGRLVLSLVFSENRPDISISAYTSIRLNLILMPMFVFT